MSIQCPKCKAGAGSLEALTEILADGTTLQTVRCTVCGWRISRPAPGRAVENPARDADGIQPFGPARCSRMSAARAASIAAHSEPCAVPGCDGSYYAKTASLPLCKTHRNRLQSWNASRRATWPPVACVNGHWLERGHPLPAITAKGAVKVQGPRSKVQGPRSKVQGPRSKVQGCADNRYRTELGRLAQVGNRSAQALLKLMEG